MNQVERQPHGEKGDAQAAPKADQARVDRTALWMMLLTAVIAIAGAISAAIFWKQLGVMERQLSEMANQAAITKSQTRANVTISFRADLIANKRKSGRKWMVTPILKNVGTTEAVKVDTYVNSGMFDDKTIEGFDFRQHSLGTNPSLTIGQASEILQLSQYVSHNDERLILAGYARMVIWGHVRYEDIFHQPHQLHYCALVVPHLVKEDDVRISFPLYKPGCYYSE